MRLSQKSFRTQITQIKMRKLTQSYQIGIQQITFYFTNLICENLCCLRYLRAFDTVIIYIQVLRTCQHAIYSVFIPI